MGFNLAVALGFLIGYIVLIILERKSRDHE